MLSSTGRKCALAALVLGVVCLADQAADQTENQTAKKTHEGEPSNEQAKQYLSSVARRIDAVVGKSNLFVFDFIEQIADQIYEREKENREGPTKSAKKANPGNRIQINESSDEDLEVAARERHEAPWQTIDRLDRTRYSTETVRKLRLVNLQSGFRLFGLALNSLYNKQQGGGAKLTKPEILAKLRQFLEANLFEPCRDLVERVQGVHQGQVSSDILGSYLKEARGTDVRLNYHLTAYHICSQAANRHEAIWSLLESMR